MLLDKKLAKLLSEFFLDISKAWFIASFISPVILNQSGFAVFTTLSKGVFNVIFYLIVSYWFNKRS